VNVTLRDPKLTASGGKSQTHGAFAELLAVPYDLVFNIPQELSYEEAATIRSSSQRCTSRRLTGLTAIPFFTSTLSMHQLMGLDSPTPDKSLPLKPKSEWLLIWSGASAVGQYAIQLGKLAGYKVVTTASQDNWELLKSYGAQETFDYKDKDVAEKIKAATATDGGVNYAFDW
jgi:NADPH:quinone reductase-like Zn-dependent oxidoreductase